MTFNAAETAIIKSWNAQQKERLIIHYLATADPRSEQFQAAADALSEEASKLEVVVKRSAETKPPAFLLGPSWHYHAIPHGAELEPFLSILSSLNIYKPEGPVTLAERLESIRQSLRIQLFVAAQCPHCPQVVRQLISIPQVHPFARIDLIDGMLFPEIAEQLQVRSVPTLILNDTYRWTGQVHLDDLLDVLEKPSPCQLSPKDLERMLKEAQASRLAELMLESQEVFPAFIELIVHPEWSVRLGAMVVMEEVAESDMDLARTALGPLWQKFALQDVSIKGDILYLIGELGGSDWLERIEPLLHDEHQELRNAALEAADKLRA